MDRTNFAIAVESSRSCLKVKSLIEQLIQEVEEQSQDLKFLNRSPKYTPIIKKQVSALEQKILHNKDKILEAKAVLKFPLNSRVVLQGENKPGKILDYQVAGKISTLEVLWDNCTVPIPERPARLKLVDPKYCDYIWNGDRHSKLVRPIDNQECDNAQILAAELNQLQLETNLKTDLELQIEFKHRIDYCTKRIDYLESKQLEQLERVVKEGLAIFYKVGEALGEIRDRQLYKRHGYSDFRDYLKEHWSMGKSRAYQLISAAEVVKNISESETVHNCGQNISESTSLVKNLIPQSESVAREVAKAPPKLQAKAMEVALTRFGDNPTAKEVKEVVAELVELNQDSNNDSLDSNCSNEQNTVSIVADYKVGQLVQIKVAKNRPDKRLVGLESERGVIISINSNSLDLKLQNQTLSAVSPNDIIPCSELTNHVFHLSATYEQAAKLIIMFDSPEEILSAAIDSRSLKEEDYYE